MKNQTIFKSETGRRAILDGYDGFLKSWPMPYETAQIATRHGSTFVLTSGPQAAPALVLIHGSAANSAMWAGEIPAFTSAFRAYALDIPGEPGKSEVTRFPLEGPEAAEWLGDVLNGLGLEQVCLLGISLGGFMALKLATACPERVQKLVLLCPGGIARQKRSFMFKVIPLMFLGDWGLTRINRIINGNVTLHEEALRYIRLIAKEFAPRMEVVPVLPDSELRRLQMPVMLIAGERDALLPSQKTASRLKMLLPHAQVNLLPGTGHLVTNQASRIMPFLLGEVQGV